MKIQCDVCSQDEASVFCCADEAALCDSCDQKVHYANKVASKHQRLSLSSSIQTQPLCDICKEKAGYVFCQEDRAILCVNCDDSVHSANKLTMKHSRFLLTGARISDIGNKNKNIKTCDLEKVGQDKSTSFEEKNSIFSNGSSSIISEYLTKTLPGYCVEDLLTDDVNGFYQNDEMFEFSEPEFANPTGNDFQIWVPQVQSMNFLQTNVNGSMNINFGIEKEKPKQQFNVGRKQMNDDCFMVPQINSPVTSNNYKRFRPTAAWDF